MEFDMDKINTKEENEQFFEEHKTEIIAQCMRLQPINNGITKALKIETQILAMNHIAEKYEYGPFRHQCDNCTLDPTTCNANTETDIMCGWGQNNDNVCFCIKFSRGEIDEGKPTIETEAPYSG
ncbi:MAG: hypothetical protein E4G94_06265 [ANME-2 cluster archaeon]|nr:MAG: hypothetical protein E4G94_06265 [ANME-2 cluster archaeon]